MKTKLYNSAILLSSFFSLLPAYALNPIIRPYQSVRAAGMGNVRYTTGLYEENFFANPARTAANPTWRIQLPKITLEAGTGTLDTVSDLTRGGSSGLSGFADAIGRPISGRVQLLFPAYYSPHFLWADLWAIGVGSFLSLQTVSSVGAAGQIDPTTVLTAGPTLSIARRLLEDRRLVVGVNLHTHLRASSGEMFSVVDFLSKTKSVGTQIRGGSGIGIDGDLGATFRPRWGLLGFEYQLAAAINNVGGGNYNNLKKSVLTGWSKAPIRSARSYNLGVSASHKSLAFLDDLTIAIESTDIGNNTHGSFFKTLHIGSEATWSIFRLRAGINQGYYCAGAGINLGVFELNVATYEEELGLNAGVRGDRRYALDLGFQI